MFDARRGDDPRDRDDNSRDLSRGSRGGSDPRERERVDPRDVFMEHVNLPRGLEREHVHHHGHDYTLRGSETRTLTTVGAFRSVPASDRLPIGIHPAGCGVVVYVVTDPWLDEFRVFLLRHAALLRALPAWTLRIVVPPQFPDIGQRAKQVVWNQLMTPLKTDILDELRWYFEQARAHPAPSRCRDLDERFYRARDAFSEPRFKALYRVWKQDGDAAFAACRIPRAR